jgi:hypothetical protein
MMIALILPSWDPGECRRKGKRTFNLVLSLDGKEEARSGVGKCFPSLLLSEKVSKIILFSLRAPVFSEPRLKCYRLLQLIVAGSAQLGHQFGSGGICPQIKYILQVLLKKMKSFLFHYSFPVPLIA